jgi:hypothetical protein
MRKKQYLALTLILILAISFLSGCSSPPKPEDEPTDFMAWQFAQAVVRPRVNRPSNAVFPRYSGEFVQREEDKHYVISAYVNTLDDESNTIVYDFTVAAKYVANDVFEEVSVEVKRR